MIILGIETSCDETAVAVVEDGRRILANLVSTQVKFHSRYGGVIPEVASRKQIELINPLLNEALKKSRKRWQDIDAVAVASRPGLIGSLLVGISTASALAYANNLPLIEVNHVEAHLYANFLEDSAIQMPFTGLVVSGGHTSIFLVRNHRDMELLGETRDDAAGEAFDKVAKLLGLSYPGGPEIEKLAERGNPEKVKFPRPYLYNSFDFSFSGLKTAVAYYIKEKFQVPGSAFKLTDRVKCDIASGFQESVVEVLVNKTIRVARKKGVKRIAIGGGVAANKRLRLLFKQEAEKYGMELFIPPLELCLDNAAMVAARAYYQNKFE